MTTMTRMCFFDYSRLKNMAYILRVLNYLTRGRFQLELISKLLRHF